MLAFKYRIHDAQLGRFLSIDPLAPDYPWNSPYAFSENRVGMGVELEGLELSTWENQYIDYCSELDLSKVNFNKERLEFRSVYSNAMAKANALPNGLRERAVSGIEEMSFYWDIFHMANREYSRFSAKRYLEGSGGVVIFPSNFVSGDEVTEKGLKNFWEGKVREFGSENESGQFAPIVTELQGRQHGLASDLGSTLGNWRVDMTSLVNISHNSTGNLEGFGTVYFTVSDKYDFSEDAPWFQDWVDHDEAIDAQLAGAKPFIIRSYYKVNVSIKNGSFQYSQPIESYDQSKHYQPSGGYAIPPGNKTVKDLR